MAGGRVTDYGRKLAQAFAGDRFGNSRRFYSNIFCVDTVFFFWNSNREFKFTDGILCEVVLFLRYLRDEN